MVGTVLILDDGSVDLEFERAAICLHERMSLAALTFLPAL